MIRIFLIILLFIMVPFINTAQVIATFEVDLPAATNGLIIPVSVSLKDFKSIPNESSLALIQMDGSRETFIPFQVTGKKEKALAWLVKQTNEQTKIIFRLIKRKPLSKNFGNKMTNVEGFGKITTTDKDGAYIISAENKNLLSYVHKKVNPPAGVDPAYGRSGFIHPLWTPHGQELTTIQPKDHYHHYGIWNPWTHVLFEADTVDFWNIGGKKATVRFAKLISRTDGEIFSEIKVLHEHVVFKKEGGEKIALNEIQTIRVYKPEAKGDYYIMDFTSEMNCASQSPFHIVAYRYGGFGWRATEFWTKDNSEMLTSEGKTRDNTDGSKAKWCIVYGALPGNEEGGAVMLSHPENYNHPEPLRIWDKKANGGRGDVFANFAPTKDKDWILEPGKTYTLKYRMVVFNGKFDAVKAGSAWEYFAKPGVVKIVK